MKEKLIVVIFLFMTSVMTVKNQAATLLLTGGVDQYVTTADPGYWHTNFIDEQNPKGYFSFYLSNQSNSLYWTTEFIAPVGDEQLEVGSYSKTDQRLYPTNTRTFTFTISGTNYGVESFQIQELEWGQDRFPTKAAVDFVFLAGTTPAYGSYRFNSDVPSTVPEPCPAIILGLLGFGLVAQRKR